jgi:AcrR family transcriptional regulator
MVGVMMNAKDGATGAPAAAATAPRGARKRDRAATESALMAAAIRLLERDGVLAGLNLQEVSDEAGLNRGLIHHYFGSRQALLRAALQRGVESNREGYLRSRHRPADEKGQMELWAYLRDPRYARLQTLLALDGDDQFEPIPYYPERLNDAMREQAAGAWAADTDLPAMLAIWDTFLYGYIDFREALSRQMGIPLAKLDTRVFALLDRMFAAIKGR